MQALIICLWGTQGIFMFFDEFKFHHQRGLKKWERMGHPIDTLFFLVPFIYIQFFSNIYLFIGLCVFSSLLITKDEFVHARECEASEQWLHSVLFVIHPVALYGLWLAWENNFHTIIQVQGLILIVFMIYQIIYWNFIKGIHEEA